jgi:hypothetical protein
MTIRENLTRHALRHLEPDLSRNAEAARDAVAAAATELQSYALPDDEIRVARLAKEWRSDVVLSAVSTVFVMALSFAALVVLSPLLRLQSILVAAYLALLIAAGFVVILRGTGFVGPRPTLQSLLHDRQQARLSNAYIAGLLGIHPEENSVSRMNANPEV